MTIAPIVKKDCCGPVIDSSGKLFYRMQHPERSRSTIIYKKMLIPYIDITGYNYYVLLNAKKRPPMNEKNCHHGSQSRTFQKRICLLMGMRIVGDHLSGTAQTFKYSDAPLSEDFARTAHRFGLWVCIQLREIRETLCPDFGKMIKIMVECGKFGQIGIKECLAEKFPETTDFF